MIDISRINRLQTRMNARKPTICPERAEIYTASYKQTEGQPIILRRAKAFAATLDQMKVYAEPDSLIIGNYASANFAAPIFPEYSYQWVIDELDDFEHRRGDYFFISDDNKERLRKLAEYWIGRTHQDEVNNKMTPANILAQAEGVLHRGGISMSGHGHIIPNHEFVLEKGFGGIINIAKEKLLTENDEAKINYYNAAILAFEGALRYCKRLGLPEGFMENGARSFREAVQTVYILHLLIMIESNGHSVSFGRFDQYIEPYYQHDISTGIISDDYALEIITHFFIMLNSLNKVRPWGHTKYSNGYPLYSNLTVGGMKPDGTDGTNDISYMCIKAMDFSKLPEPNFSVRFWEHSPHELILESARLIRKGFGMPSMFCDEVCIAALKTLDIGEHTARDYSPSGCVEIAIPGKWGHRATGMTYINFARVFEIILHNGEYNTYDELWQAWKSSLRHYFDLAVESDFICDSSLKYHDADVFASSTIDCCLERGLTLHEGGAMYDYISQSNIGMSVVGDSLAAVKKLVFEDAAITMDELKTALKNNFECRDGQRIRKMCQNAPKFGNDDDYADYIVADVFESYLELLPGRKNERFGKGPIGCGYTMSTSNITSYVPCGFNVGATPDGRLAGKPLNEGASPCLGADREGPTAVINSVSKLPNEKMAGGQLLNMRFSPASLSGETNLEKFANFIKAGRHKNIFHNQFNIIDSETLIKAKENPEDYPNLMVRVAGYCALFTTLAPEAQDAIIERTELGL